MKLTELDHTTRANASKALREHYELPFNIESIPMLSTRTMLQKVRGLIKESKRSTNFYENQTKSSYMKLVFMEQALASHYAELRSQPQARIVVENEEVEKSQVILAAQDLVDSVQKMLEDVGQMQVKELPALVSSIESEIGVNESQAYNEEVSAQLDALTGVLKEALGSLKNALNGITPQGASASFDAGAEMGAEMGDEEEFDAGEEAGMDMGMGDEGMPAPEELEAPEIPPVGGVGRAKR